LEIEIMSRYRIVLCLLLPMVVQPLARAQAPEAVLLRSGLIGERSELVDGVSARLGAAGYAVRELGLDDLCDPAKLTELPPALLVLPNGGALPAASVDSIEAYLKTGGDILALNAPLWQQTLVRDGAGWADLAEFRRKCLPELLPHVLFDFSTGIDDWQRTVNDPNNFASHTVEPGQPAPIETALHVTIKPLNNWDTFVSPPLDKGFPEGNTLTVFYAKGGPQTTELAIEWTEKDLSRWIATVPLTGEWQQYVLEPKDFRYWESNPSRAGGELDPANVMSMSVGLAHTHTHLVGDEHEYWLGPFGTAPRTPDHEKMMTAIKRPMWELLSPGYKFYPCSEVASLQVRADQVLVSAAALPLPSEVRTSPPRPRAAGFNKGRAWRWEPIIEARTAAGEWRGAPAALLVNTDGPYKGGVWVSFAIGDLAWYENPEVLDIIGNVVARMREGLFLVDGGTNFYTYFENQDITFGVRAMNAGSAAANGLTAHVTLSDPASQSVFEKTWPLDIAAGTQFTVSATMRPETWPEKGFRAVAEIRRGDTVLDRTEHEIQVWKPKAKPSYVTVENGDFMLDGKRWRAHGVNYMPSSGIATEDGPYFEYWVGARSYDPEIIDRDLRHLVDMGINAVSIFIHREVMESQNLLDLFRRLDALGLKANLSLRPGTPFDFEWDMMRELIQYYRIPEQDCVFALDLAWEPMFPDHEGRKRWDPEWRTWIDERYGNIENAEKDWGFAAPRDADGAITNPLGQHTVEDGDWRVMTAAYRRFLDTLLYENYGRARRLVRSLDPHHLVSFRMAEAGNPTCSWDKIIPYDWPYLASAVDVLEPEGYGRIGEWEKVKPGWFEFEYARWAAPNLPMFWAEAGVHAWVESMMTATPERLDFQAEYYANLYRMFIGSAADGVFFWWFPGGYRVGERSDFGIINLDGSDRAVTKVIREHARAFLDGPSAKPVDHWIEIDRDLHPDGVNGIYAAAKDEFWKAIDEGQTPGLKTAGTGTDSATCPLVAVGNTPCNGNNPPKYLDGFFDVVEIKDASGEWVEAARGAAVRTGSETPPLARITITNLAEAAWLSPANAAGGGGVQMVAISSGETATPLPENLGRGKSITIEIPLCSAPITAETAVTLTLEAVGRSRFGPKHVLILQP
jgi:hypothetical protein